MALPVVTVASGGLPVVEAAIGMPVTEATNLRGLAVTKVTGGKAGLAVVYVSATGGSGFTGATMDGTKLNYLTTGAGLVAKRNSTIAGGSASASFKSSGKYYYEFSPNLWALGTLRSGVIMSGQAVDNSAGVGNTCVNFGSGTTLIYTNGASTGKNLGATVAGDMFAGAIDLDNRLAWFRRNNGSWNADGTANPATGVGGVLVLAGSFAPWVAGSGAAGSVDEVTFNFNQSAFAGTVPSGFSAGWPV